ncbi:MAG: cohesin domain-containing protein [Pseudomonadota bacterium]
MRFFAFVLVALGFFNSQASAAGLAITPSLTIVNLGDQVVLDLDAEFLGDGVAPSIGSFDIDVLYDQDSLAFVSVDFGMGLDLFGFGSLQTFDAGVPGIVNIAEMSLDLPSDLDALQMSSFTLATLVFDTLKVGTSIVTASVNSAFDAEGVEPIVFEVLTGTVTVVPVPGALPLMLSAILGGIGLRRWRARA